MPVRTQNPPRIVRPHVTPPFYERYYNQSAQFVKNRCYQLYAKIPTTNQVWQTSKGFFLRHKVVILSGVALTAILALLEYYRRTRPEYPLVEMKSSLNFAKLHLEVPIRERRPVNVTLTFCIDKSSSMADNGRMDAVKTALSNVLENAQGIVNASPEAQIKIAIIAFDDNAATINPGEKLTKKGSEKSIGEKILEQVLAINASGATQILKGVGEAANVQEKMANDNPSAAHTFVLLSDGEDGVNAASLTSIHKKLANVNTRMFAIGIGKGHNQNTLKTIVAADQDNPPFQGKYIDATQGGDTIVKAIKEIYEAAIASFNDLQLTSRQLAAGTWSVDGVISTVKGEETVCSLANIAEAGKRAHQIRIHAEDLQAPLELSNVTFTLKFVDPRGRKGQLDLPWNPNTVADPAIIKA